MKIVRPAKLDDSGKPLPPLVQFDKSRKSNPLAIGIMFVFLFILGSMVLMGIFSFYDYFFRQPVYEPAYMTLRDNLTMPDGRTYWDDNNETDMLIAADILEIHLNKKIVKQENETEMTVEEFIASSKKRSPGGIAGRGGGGSK